MRNAVLLLAGLVLGTGVVGTGSRLDAANRLFLDSQTLKANSTGLQVLVKMDCDFDVYAVSLALSYNPSHLQITKIEPFGSSAGAEWEATNDFGQINNTTGQAIYGFLTEYDFQGGTDQKIPAGAGQVIARITLNTANIAKTTSKLEFKDGIGTVSSVNAIVNNLGVTYRKGSPNALTTLDATYTIDPLKPVIQLAAGSGVGGTVFDVVGLNFNLPGLSVKVCGQTTAAALQPDNQTLKVTAPASCATCPAGQRCCVVVEVCNENGCEQKADGFCYVPPPVPVISIPPGNTGLAGDTFFVEGQNFTAPLTVKLCTKTLATPGDYTVIGPNSLRLRAPVCENGGWAVLEICNGVGCDTEANGYFYETSEPLPDITGVPPGNTGGAGDTFFVDGSNFQTPGIRARVCGAAATVQVISDNSIKVTAPACTAQGWAILEVCNDAGCDTEANGFFYETVVLRPFVRGDANNNSEVDLIDAIAILTDKFLGQPARAPCRDALDVTDDGQILINDPLALLTAVFIGGFVIPPPNLITGPGVDPTEPDALGECI